MDSPMVNLKFDYVVLLYPPLGVPRVAKVPRLPPDVVMTGIQRFSVRGEAEAALEKFLTENPEYRQWRDGSIQPTTDNN